MPLRHLVERSYGGKAGVWFRKKSRSCKTTRSSSGVGARHVATMERSVAEQSLPKSLKQESTEHAEMHRDDDDQLSHETEPPSDDGDASDEEDRVETDHGWFGGTAATMTSSRSYGSRERKRAAVVQVPVERKRKRGRAGSTPLSRVSTIDQNMMFLPSPRPATPSYKPSICGALNSVSKATPTVLLKSCQMDTPTNVAVVSTDHHAPRQDTNTRRNGLPPRRKRMVIKKPAPFCKPNGTPDLSGTIFDLAVHDEVVSQPSSKTSVDAARVFFERLDSTQKLTLDSSQSPGKPSVRTRRSLSNTASKDLHDEHHDYIVATRGVGVAPLSLQDYAKNRSAYFRTKGMYDGFLDG